MCHVSLAFTWGGNETSGHIIYQGALGPNEQGAVIPYTAVVTAKTGVKKWSSGVFGVGQEVKDKF